MRWDKMLTEVPALEHALRVVLHPPAMSSWKGGGTVHGAQPGTPFASLLLHPMLQSSV